MDNLAGKTVIVHPKRERDLLVEGAEYRVEGLWEEVSGISWMYAEGNPACIQYALRSAMAGIPLDNKVYYGKVGSLGYLVHESEIGEEV